MTRPPTRVVLFEMNNSDNIYKKGYPSDTMNNEVNEIAIKIQ